jgi:hypothetical protein
LVIKIYNVTLGHLKGAYHETNGKYNCAMFNGSAWITL